MKFTLLVLVALGLTMTWQASVVADNNNKQQDNLPQLTAGSVAPQAVTRDRRG